MAELLPRVGMVRLASERYLRPFRDQIIGIVGIGSFFNAQLERYPRDIDLLVVTPNSLVQEVTISSPLISHQLRQAVWDMGIRLPVQVGIWPERVDPTVPWYDPVLGDTVKQGLVLAGNAPKWPND